MQDIQQIVADYIQKTFGDRVPEIRNCMSVTNVIKSRLLVYVLVVAAVCCLYPWIGAGCIGLVIAATIPLGKFIMRREAAYFDDGKIVYFMSIGLLNTGFSRREISFAEIRNSSINHDAVKGAKITIFTLNLRDNTSFEIRVDRIYNDKFVANLEAQLRSLNLVD